MAREFFNFGNADDYQPKPFVLKHNQNAEGHYEDFDFSSTMTLLTVKGYDNKGERKIVTVGVKRAKDFNFDAMYEIAKKSLKKKPNFNSDSYQKRSKKERKRPQY